MNRYVVVIQQAGKNEKAFIAQQGICGEIYIRAQCGTRSGAQQMVDILNQNGPTIDKRLKDEAKSLVSAEKEEKLAKFRRVTR